MNTKCKHINPQGRLCRNDAAYEYKGLHFCDDHIDNIRHDDQLFDRALICLKHRTRNDNNQSQRKGAVLSSFINWCLRNRFEVIQIDPDGGYVCHTWTAVRKQWEQTK